MTDFLNMPELQKCSEDISPGDSLFLEGDDTRDMYVLVSGRLEVLKDNKVLLEINKSGSLVGEMSYLLDSRRTATVRAINDVRVIRVPGDKVEGFLVEFPSLAPQISRGLAQRLKETTKVMHGFREFCDQLPDAVIMTDMDRNILAWNRAAEKLHGRSWQEMKGQPLAEVYRDPSEYQEFIDKIRAGHTLSEKVLKIKHPDKDEQYVSISSTVIYDAHHNVEGYLFLGRDVTSIKSIEKKYRQIRNWMVPVIIGVALMIVALFVSIPHFSKGVRMLDLREDSFRTRIIQDSQALSVDITSIAKDAPHISLQQLFQEYFADNAAILSGINGLMLLDSDKKVTGAFWPGRESDAGATLGTSYSGITFRGKENSPYKHLTLFRTDCDNPRGVKGEEIAYKLPGQPGWLVFQLDMECLNMEFGIDAKMLDKIDFQ
jgi:PAS domain S-box-containing protein